MKNTFGCGLKTISFFFLNPFLHLDAFVSWRKMFAAKHDDKMNGISYGILGGLIRTKYWSYGHILGQVTSYPENV